MAILGLFGGFWAWIWAYFRGFEPGLGNISPILRVLGLDSSLIWALSGGPGPGFGPFWAYFKPKSVHLGDLWWIWAISGGGGVLALDSGYFGGTWAYFKPKSGHLGDLGLDLANLCGILGLDSGRLGVSWTYFKPRSGHLGDLGLDLGHFKGSWAWIWAFLGLF